MRLAKVFQQFRLVLLGQRAGFFLFGNSCRLQLLKQHGNRQSQFRRKLRYV